MYKPFLFTSPFFRKYIALLVIGSILLTASPQKARAQKKPPLGLISHLKDERLAAIDAVQKNQIQAKEDRDGGTVAAFPAGGQM